MEKENSCFSSPHNGEQGGMLGVCVYMHNCGVQGRGTQRFCRWSVLLSESVGSLGWAEWEGPAHLEKGVGDPVFIYL